MVRLEVFDETPIGQGMFSTVYNGAWDSELVAVKRLRFREDGEYFKEAAILKRLDHDNIISFFGMFKNDEGTYDIVLELGCGVTLADALHRDDLTMAWKRSTIHQLASGLAFMHGRRVLHLDLKPRYILFKDRDLQRVLIADFGMATVAPESRRAGARKFRAPDFPTFTQKSDVFSLASIACCILAERNPETPEETTKIVALVLKQQERSGNPTWHLHLGRGVSTDPFLRPTASQFRDAFKIPRVDPPPVQQTRVPPPRVFYRPRPTRHMDREHPPANHDDAAQAAWPTRDSPAKLNDSDGSWIPRLLFIVFVFGILAYQAFRPSR